MTQPAEGAEERLWYVGLGSNMGDRERVLREAVRRLDARPQVRVVRTSHLYETDPWGDTDQPAFLNQVAVVCSALGPLALLAEAKRVEAELGRQARRRWGPREIDVDLLYCDGLQMDTPDLTVPHPLMLERQFVLVPLAELSPDLVLPDGRPVSSHVNNDGSVRPWTAGEP